MAQYDALQSEFESAAAPILFSQSARSSEQDVPAFPRAVDRSANQPPLSSAEARHPIIPATNGDARAPSTVPQSASGEELSRQDVNTSVHNTESYVRKCAAEVDGSPSLLHHAFDTMMERGIIIYENSLAKNSCDGCPICLREFNGRIVTDAFGPVAMRGTCPLCRMYLSNQKTI